MDGSIGYPKMRPFNALDGRKLEEQLLTDNVDEEEYDALNDETFGALDEGDWEEGHDKYAELLKEPFNKSPPSLFDSSGFFGDDSQNDVVSQSISQLGLEDDLDDPAIMTIGRSCTNWNVGRLLRSSPPPPAIIDPELCGSPKTHSIWSTNTSSLSTKESGIGSVFSSGSYQHPSSISPASSSIFASPLAQKAWTLEEIERDLTSPKASSVWSGTSSNHSEPNQSIPKSHEPIPIGKENLLPNKAELKAKKLQDILKDIDTDLQHHHHAQTVEEVVRSMKPPSPPPPLPKPTSDPKRVFPFPPVVNGLHPKPEMWPFNSGPRFGFPNPISIPRLGVRHGGPFPFPHGISPDKMGNFPGGFRPNFKPVHVHPTINPMPTPAFNKNMMPPPKKQMFYPTSVLNPQNMKNLFGPGRLVRHPLLGTTLLDYSWAYPNNFAREMRASENVDPYAGLMTQSEKEWLLRIQMMLVQTSNPYVEDFYFSTFVTRKCVEEAQKNKKESPKLLLPERAKTETKAYVPAQFEGSLGKLQAVSVNFPRKVLDITVSRPLEDEDGHPVTNQSVSKNRRLLLSIEKLYNYLLEIDDEEKRILALPDNAHAEHRDTIEKLTEKLFTGLGCDSLSSHDTLQNIMVVRKGRNLGMRCYHVFSKTQKLSFLVCLFRCLSHVLRRDERDPILLKHCDDITEFIKTLSLPELVQLGQSLENLPRSDVILPNPVREKSHYISAFKNKFGTSVVCCKIQRAEEIYLGQEPTDSEHQAKWAKVVLHMVDIICTLPENSIVSPIVPYENLLAHFQRFAVDRDKFEVLKKKLELFKSDRSMPADAV